MRIAIIVWSLLILAIAIGILGWGSLLLLVGAIAVFLHTINNPRL